MEIRVVLIIHLIAVKFMVQYSCKPYVRESPPIICQLTIADVINCALAFMKEYNLQLCLKII